MIFESIKESQKPNKKLVITFSDPDLIIHFGSKNSNTYLDHKDKKIRQNYINRHEINENWDEVNPGSLSRYLLWGSSTKLEINLLNYLKKFNIKY
jgi:5'-3' exonuclease